MSKQTNCTGKSLFDERNLGGHIEDYIPDPNNPQEYPKSMRWVPVSQSFQKS